MFFSKTADQSFIKKEPKFGISSCLLLAGTTPKHDHFASSSTSSIRALKLVFVIFYRIFIFSPNDNPSKTMKKVFYFI